MENLYVNGNLAKELLISKMIKDYEKEIRDNARIANLVRQATPIRPAWYCPLLIKTGEMLIASGTYLKAHYSTQPALRTR